MQTDEPQTAQATIEIDADLDRVWQLLTTDDGLAAWMGDGSSIGSSVGDDLLFDDVVTGERRAGFIEERRVGQELRYRWWPETNPERSTSVSITLEPSESGTVVTVTESAPAGASMAMASSVAGPAWNWRMALMVLATTSVALVASQAR